MKRMLFKASNRNYRRTAASGHTLSMLLLSTAALNGPCAFAQDNSWSSDDSRLGLLQRVTTLIQKKVVDRNERRVGKLEDVIIDLNHAQVPFTLVSVGGGDQLTLLPAENYAYLSKPKLVLSVDRKAVQGAPQVPRTNP